MDFSHCKDEKQAKEVYRKLAKTYHPDAGGSNEKMQQLTKNYDACLERLKMGSAPGFNANSNPNAYWQSYRRWAGSPNYNNDDTVWSFRRDRYSHMGADEKVEDPVKNEFKPRDSMTLDDYKKLAEKYHSALLRAQKESADLTYRISIVNSRNDGLEARNEDLEDELKTEKKKRLKAEKNASTLKKKFNEFKERFSSPKQELKA